MRPAGQNADRSAGGFLYLPARAARPTHKVPPAMTVLVTGAAGFIGFHVAGALLRRGERVVGVDSLDTYYDVGLKEARLSLLAPQPGFRMVRGDLAEPATLERVLAEHPGIDRIVHLAAQAGVRYSLENPRAYIRANVGGHLEVLEAAR